MTLDQSVETVEENFTKGEYVVDCRTDNSFLTAQLDGTTVALEHIRGILQRLFGKSHSIEQSSIRTIYLGISLNEQTTTNSSMYIDIVSQNTETIVVYRITLNAGFYLDNVISARLQVNNTHDIDSDSIIQRMKEEIVVYFQKARVMSYDVALNEGSIVFSYFPHGLCTILCSDNKIELNKAFVERIKEYA